MKHKKENFFTKLKNLLVITVLTFVMFLGLQGYTDNSNLRFVQVSDVHFAKNGANTTFKMIEESPKLLDDAIEQTNNINDVDFVMFSGDLLDKSYVDELNAVLSHVKQLNCPWYFAFGNHDTCVGCHLTKQLYLNILSQNNSNFIFNLPYYSFVPKKGFKVIVLDSIIDTKITSNGFIDEKQLNWLDNELKNSQKDVVLIFLHMPIIEPYPSSDHQLKNSIQVKNIIEKYKNPIGVFSGHYHATRIFQVGNVLYINSPALVSFPNAFRLVEVSIRRNKAIFSLTYKETGLKNVQKLAKLLVFASSIYTGEENDRNATFEIKMR